MFLQKDCEHGGFARGAGAAFPRDGVNVWGSTGVGQRRPVRWKGCEHGGCTRCVGETLARDGGDGWSSIGGEAGKRGQRRLERGKGCKNARRAVARDERDVWSSIGGDAGQRGRDGLYVGRAAKKGVVLAARGRGQRMSVTEETLGAVSASRGAGGAETPCTSEGLQKCSLRPLNGGSARA